MSPRAALAAALAISTLLGTAGCAAPGSDRPQVVVTTNILGDVVQRIAGDEADVLVLMRPDADPHSFQISLQEAARLRSADLVVSNGLGLEEGLQRHLDAADVPRLVVGEQVETLTVAGEDGGAVDPHFWTDPARMRVAVDAIGVALAEVDGVDPAAVAASSAAYRARLDRLDAEMTAAFAAIPASRRALVTNHHVFGYLADRYGFRVLGAVIPSGTTLAAPSASDLASLVEAIDAAGVPAVFAESSSPARLAEALAAEADRDVEVVELFTESLTGPDGGAPDYLTMMRVNTARIATGLSP